MRYIYTQEKKSIVSPMSWRIKRRSVPFFRFLDYFIIVLRYTLKLYGIHNIIAPATPHRLSIVQDAYISSACHPWIHCPRFS